MQTGTHPTRWSRALYRAECHNLIARKDAVIEGASGEATYYKVKSASRPAIEHGVRIFASAEGVTTDCSCEAGLKNMICQHMAVSLRAEGLLPDLMLTETADQLPAAA